MEDNDLWRLAAILLQRHGDDAESYARQKAVEALRIRNQQSGAAWNRIALAVNDLERRSMPISDLN